MIPGKRANCQHSLEEVTADMVEMARELKLEVELEYGTELLQSHDKTLMHEELLLTMSEESSFLRWNLLPVKTP